VIGGAAGNGAVVVCNRLLVQRGAPDQYRGRALATIMSSNYAVLGLAMAAAGVLTDVFGARAVWIAASLIYEAIAAMEIDRRRTASISRTRTSYASANSRWRKRTAGVFAPSAASRSSRARRRKYSKSVSIMVPPHRRCLVRLRSESFTDPRQFTIEPARLAVA